MQQYLTHPKKTNTGTSKKVHCSMILPSTQWKTHDLCIKIFPYENHSQNTHDFFLNIHNQDNM
jgi:hypothetical protein